ncbi:ArsO family NAD(P)H-dependent flavin-containing monooxygenase [Taibaiella soli]|uniref:Pyridine nucleotide-disulfide oxidoreductase n=1 Tax=Taibaiella soli TaxID=1649169 RepID=A0A2W2B5Y4_9BACT|nr:ArsO family NAD(P)H-dependent flavin-containing monooxygenase [Taibaiella soli]PZF71619.1 pyridine nucleotide-disulfide oxidoreductase [Taibaiella soli]
MTMEAFDVIIIGGGQSALACAYFLRRTDLSYIILDDQLYAGGAWQQAWDSLTLFSPSEYSSLPGWMMPKSQSKFPTKNEVISYLAAYEERYKIQVRRPVEVNAVYHNGLEFELNTSAGTYRCKALISATGNWNHPIIPDVPGKEGYQGTQLHSAHYKNANDLIGKRVLIVGNGNSGAQILAEVSKVATTVWAVQKEPEYLPDEVDGRVLFDIASAKYHALQSGKDFDAKQYSLGNIVMVPSVVDARERDVLHYRKTFQSMTPTGVIWEDGTTQDFDAIIWCTGFNPALDHLKSLGIMKDQQIETTETKCNALPGLYLVGYGNKTGFASATLIGVSRSARSTVNDIIEHLKHTK